MIANTHYGYVKKASKLQFTYTGQYNQREDGVVELLTSGTLVFLNPAVIDIFCVGGGGAGALPSVAQSVLTWPGGGGGGGYTTTVKQQQVEGEYAITVGAGSAIGGAEGGATTFGSIATANGGKTGAYLSAESTVRRGANGGCGGGGARQSTTAGGSGGADGASGSSGGTGFNANSGGSGQGTTTREFGEVDGKLYAGGGGGGTYISSATPVQTMGGTGGGGAGGWSGTSTSQGTQPGGSGGANTGGGGGGGVRGYYTSVFARPGAGGSGIVCFRVSK